MLVLERLLNENSHEWEHLLEQYERTNRSLKVPSVERTSLYEFNVAIEEAYTRALYDFGRARRNRDAIQRLIKNVLDDYYQGQNEQARKAAGIQYAKKYPTPEGISHPTTVNLFDLEDRFVGYYYSLEATIKSLQAKADAKITNNSLLNTDRALLTNAT